MYFFIVKPQLVLSSTLSCQLTNVVNNTHTHTDAHPYTHTHKYKHTHTLLLECQIFKCLIKLTLLEQVLYLRWQLGQLHGENLEDLWHLLAGTSSPFSLHSLPFLSHSLLLFIVKLT